MRMRYLAIIDLAKAPKELLPINESSLKQLIRLNGWRVVGYELREYGAQCWATLERDIAEPAPLHASCAIHGDRAVRVYMPSEAPAS